MRRLVLSVVAVAAVLTAVPAFADDYDGDFSVRIGRDHDHDWDRDHDRGWHGRWHFGWRDRDECRQVVVRDRLPDGTVVVRKRFRCD
ncbi:MAG TPA: hypothetical protein VHA77_12350 [Xanthobacteraceae bacterium]|jgi:hypothetical protein|nr:hypothetical protein [Xanthobacteraceae bacterium]